MVVEVQRNIVKCDIRNKYKGGVIYCEITKEIIKKTEEYRANYFYEYSNR